MANASYSNQLNPGLFLPTTDIYDSQIIKDLDITSPDFKEFLVVLRQSINNVAIAVNLKDSGYYMIDQEFVNGQAWFSNPALVTTNPSTRVFRQDFRIVVNFGVLPDTATKSVAHNIPINAASGPAYSFTRIYATASDPVNFKYIPIPYASTTTIVELNVDQTNVNITTNANLSAYTITYVVLEYLKN